MLISNFSPSYMYKLFQYSPLKIILKVIPTENSLPFSFSGLAKERVFWGQTVPIYRPSSLQKPQGKEVFSGATWYLFFPTFISFKGQDEICSPMYGKSSSQQKTAPPAPQPPCSAKYPSLESVPNGGPTGRALWQGPERQRSASLPAETA